MTIVLDSIQAPDRRSMQTRLHKSLMVDYKAMFDYRAPMYRGLKIFLSKRAVNTHTCQYVHTIRLVAGDYKICVRHAY